MSEQLSLSASQRACLRLVAQGRTSKEIAAETGLAPSTVDTYLKGAMASLGAVNRRDAARKFMILQQSQQLGSQPAPVASSTDNPKEGGEPVDEGQPVPAQKRKFGLLTPPPVGGSLNELGRGERLREVLRIACLMSIVMAGLVIFALGAIKVLS